MTVDLRQINCLYHCFSIVGMERGVVRKFGWRCILVGKKGKVVPVLN
jgi:hypothetical protein